MSPSRFVPVLLAAMRHTLGLLFIGVFFVPSSRAQQDYLLQLGTPPGSPTMNIPMGVLNLKNGNVHLEIPLRTLVQRNGLKLSSKLIYDSSNCYYQYNATECSSGWREVYSPLQFGTTPFPPYVLTTGNYVQCPAGGAQGGTWYTQYTWSNFSFTDAYGTSHGFFDILFNNTDLVCTNNPNVPITASASSLDGYSMLVTLSTPYGTPTWSVWDRHGNAIGAGKDTNGNVLSSTDELGRSYMPGAMPPGGVGSQQWAGSTIQWVSIPIHTNFGNPYDPDLSGVSLSTISSITLPDGRTYQFTYDQGTAPGNYGQIIGMTLPMGGQVGFTYANTSPTNLDSPDRRLISLSQGGATWNFAYNITYNPQSPPSSPSATTVTAPPDPAGVQNQSVYSFTAMCLGPNNTTPWSAKYYAGTASGTPLRETDMVLDCTGTRFQQQTTILDNGLSSKIVWNYQGINVTSKQEYDFSGNLARETTATYQTSTNYINLYIDDLPLSVKVYGAGGAASGPLMAQTNYAYDTTALSTTSGSAGTSVLGSTGHDDQNYGSTNTTRGNLTSVSQMVSSGNFITTKTNYYNILGEVTQTTDGRGNSTFYDYTDKWASGTSSCVPGSTFAYPATVTFPAAVTDKNVTTYSACDGTVYSVQDQNDLNASRAGTVYTYDGLQRVTNVAYPDGGSRQSNYGGTAIPQIITTTIAITSSLPMVSSSTLDGLGRTVQTELSSDPDNPTYTAITYDSLGRRYQSYNPTRCSTPTTNCGESTWGVTTTFYDALGRSCLVVPPDGTLPAGNSCPTTQPANTILTKYVGNCTTATDQAGKARKTCADALSRLTQVFEDPLGLNYETDYGYDALDNLLCVAQKGTNTGTFSSCNSIPASWRPRNFLYDSLSRLTSATNPESGAISYSYDANGNLTSKISPAPNQTGSTTVTLSYCYDALNRFTGKAYTSQSCPMSTPIATYLYDQTSYNGLTITNGIGRRTGMTDQAGAEAWSYDSMGRPLTDKRTTNSLSKSLLYTYNLDGSLASYSGPTWADGSHAITSSYTTGGAGRPLTLTINGGSLVNSLHYSPSGALCSIQQDWGHYYFSNTTFNNRLQPVRMQSDGELSAPTGTPCVPLSTTANTIDLTYSFVDSNSHNNGNAASITNNRDTTRSQTFSYDTLNRLSSAQTTSTYSTSPTHCWGEQFGYDPWGNFSTISPVSSGYTGCTQESLSMSPTTKNQLQDLNSDFVYDAAGNLTQPGPTGNLYVYDAENHLTSAAGVTYTYDGDGKRVMKSNGTIDWYGTGAAPMMETNLSNSMQFYYFYLGGSRVGRIDPTNMVTWYFADHLGSARVAWNLNGQDESDFYPFGGERVITSGVGNHYKFTGKERDAESNLDNFGARYNSSQWGRFMSPDPLGGHQQDPQTLNKYNYVRNNPLNLTDPTGLDFYLQCTDEKHNGCTQVQIDPNNKNQTWVQADQNGNATIITSDSIRAGDNTATVNENGVTINGNSQGIYFDNPASQTKDANGNVVDDRNPITLAGSGALRDFTITINGNCSGSCLSSGSWSFPGSLEDARATLYGRGSFSFPGEDEKADLGYGDHAYSTQHRFGASTCPFFSCRNSPHISVPNSWVPVPKDTVPQGFHVDAHGSFIGHQQDVQRKGVE